MEEMTERAGNDHNLASVVYQIDCVCFTLTFRFECVEEVKILLLTFHLSVPSLYIERCINMKVNSNGTMFISKHKSSFDSLTLQLKLKHGTGRHTAIRSRADERGLWVSKPATTTQLQTEARE